jgi:hypothetical protein
VQGVFRSCSGRVHVEEGIEGIEGIEVGVRCRSRPLSVLNSYPYGNLKCLIMFSWLTGLFKLASSRLEAFKGP